MYVDNIVLIFYEVLVGQQVLLLVNYDIDGLCTCKMLQWLFQTEGTIYSLVPVETITDIEAAFKEHIKNTTYVVLVNCGGTIDLVERLEPEENVVFFVIDSHRPSDLCNVYSAAQIRLIALPDEDEDIPAFNDVFQQNDSDEEEEEENEEEDESEERPDRLERIEKEAAKRRERQRWEEKKNKLMFDYYQFSYYGKSSSVLVHELIWTLSKGNVDILWYAIVGLTSYVVCGDKTQELYMEEMSVLKRHSSELSSRFSNVDCEENNSTVNSSPHPPSVSITSEMDLKLSMFRHWTVEGSLRHSLSSSIPLKLWTKKGEQRLQQILVEMGIPLAQSRQTFNSMDISLRSEFHKMILKVADTHGLEDIQFPSFALKLCYKGQYFASDFVYSFLGLLNEHEKSNDDCFFKCLDCLSSRDKELLDKGFENHKKVLSFISKQIQMSFEMKRIVLSGNFLSYNIEENTMEAGIFKRPHLLVILARYMLRAYLKVGTKKKHNRLPLVVQCNYDADHCLVLGIPPVTEFTNKNFFGRAFEQAANVLGCPIEIDYPDSSIVRIEANDRTRFLDSLSSLLS
ncbi:hypothetical protein LSTR_LSTR013794 [Laodelphax striatellus]|uniref:Uncharacterized protein n=1 Tax=Laodelphax striatellus TaxID=195883 RepID=A0A482WUF6_LAOST|nr:hypothetical protein LSTR_LSTR013794 [Laodelphax striatellus]